MRVKLVALLALLSTAAIAGNLSGTYTVKNPTADSGSQYEFPESSYRVFVLHHVGIEIC